MRLALALLTLALATAAVAAQQPDPRQQPGAPIDIYAPDQQIDFDIRSPQQNAKNTPQRQVFTHFFGMDVTWK